MGRMPCVELLEETEPSGWFGRAGDGYGSRQLKRFMGGLLILKPDSTPARRFQLFFLSMDGELRQLSEGLEEVVEIDRIYQNEITLLTTGPGDPAGREYHKIVVGASVTQEYPDDNDEQYPDDTPFRNPNIPGNSDGPLMKKSLTNINMGDPERQPCKYFEVIRENIQLILRGLVYGGA